MLQDPQDLSVAYNARQFPSSHEEARETHHRTPMHLESVSGIATAEVRIEDHLLIEEVSIEVARALEVRNWRAKLCEQRSCWFVADGWRNGVPFEAPHFHALGSPQHNEDTSAHSIEVRAGETVGRHSTPSV
jgi:hypothetical protein